MSIWFQFLILPSDSGDHIVFNCSTVRHLAHVFSGFTTTVRPSLATITSVYSIPFALHAAASSSLIGLDASEMSVSPAQNFLKPPPVPAVATVTLTPGATLRNISAAASLNGATVDDPSTVTVPLGPATGTPPVLPALLLATTPTDQQRRGSKRGHPRDLQRTRRHVRFPSKIQIHPYMGGRRSRQRD